MLVRAGGHDCNTLAGEEAEDDCEGETMTCAASTRIKSYSGGPRFCASSRVGLAPCACTRCSTSSASSPQARDLAPSDWLGRRRLPPFDLSRASVPSLPWLGSVADPNLLLPCRLHRPATRAPRGPRPPRPGATPPSSQSRTIDAARLRPPRGAPHRPRRTRSASPPSV